MLHEASCRDLWARHGMSDCLVLPNRHYCGVTRDGGAGIQCVVCGMPRKWWDDVEESKCNP